MQISPLFVRDQAGPGPADGKNGLPAAFRCSVSAMERLLAQGLACSLRAGEFVG